MPPELPEHEVAARFGGSGVLPARSSSLIPVGVCFSCTASCKQCDNCFGITLHHTMREKSQDSLCIAQLLALRMKWHFLRV